VALGEQKKLAESIAVFSQCIRLCPLYASAFNNRAQALQLKGEVDGALADVNRAIELGRGDVHVLKQAFTQRGILYHLQKKDDAALSDFQKAAALGSEYARCEAVRLNPYAAMCNAMLTELLPKLANSNGTAGSSSLSPATSNSTTHQPLPVVTPLGSPPSTNSKR